MSKRTKRILWCIPLAAVVLLAGLAALWMGDKAVSLGRFVSGDNGTCFVALDNRTAPVQLHYVGAAGCEAGDRVLVVHQNVFAESYPEQTRAYLVLKIGNGTLEDVPDEALDILHDMGYI